MTTKKTKPNTHSRPVSGESKRPTPARNGQMRAESFRRVVMLASRLRQLPGGKRLFQRFNQPEILQHWVLLSAFLLLAFTGLLDYLVHDKTAAQITQLLFKTIDNVRVVHRQAAIIYFGLALVHIFSILVVWFVKRERGALSPSGKDLGTFGAVLAYNLGLSKRRPLAGRFTIEEKLTYWGVLLFSAVMIATGLVMMLQRMAGPYMPEFVLPLSRALHALTGVMAVTLLLPWHLYHTVLKERNTSIFTGFIDEQSMQRSHALEHRQIMDAWAELRNVTGRPAPATQAATIHPVEVEPAAVELRAVKEGEAAPEAHPAIEPETHPAEEPPAETQAVVEQPALLPRENEDEAAPRAV